ncbi:MAG: alpha/beta hydrolase domain-containing protein [Chloroflexota bacterium]
MAVTGFEVRSRGPYRNGEAFGNAGSYERIDGLLHFRAHPDHASNQHIVDIEYAPRTDNGYVVFTADFCLLQPIIPERGTGNLLLEVPNRGRKLVPRMINHSSAEEVPTADIPPGDGFLMRHGWSLAWCGWQWDVVQSPALMGLNPPMAEQDGSPIVGNVLVEFQPNERLAHKILANRVHHPYPAADLNDPTAVLTVRNWPGASRSLISRDQWQFARDIAGTPVADDTHVWLAGGFEAGKVYELVYRSRISPVVGAGLLAVRDTVAFLRGGSAMDGNPAAGRIQHVLGFGMSQSGRFLRHFLHLGLNVDEAGHQVFDGLHIHVAGARRGEFNQRYGQPSVQNTPSFGHLFPFAHDEYTDSVTDRTDGLLRRQRSLGSVPRIIETNTTAEYWRGDGALGHISLDGQRDLPLPPEVRNYHFSSTQHGLGVVPLVNHDPNEGSRGAHDFNAVDYAPLLRAALDNLLNWVVESVEPPPSKYPRLADGSLVTASQALRPFETIPGVETPNQDLAPFIQRLDLGELQERGIGQYPAIAGERYPTLVPAVDADGNEIGGLRTPDLEVPVCTYTGWNPRHRSTGGPGQIISMNGSTFPFPVTREARQASNDPRLSIAERYASRTDYLDRVREAADELIAGRYMLEEDLELAMLIAEERWDHFVQPMQ